MSNYKPNFQVFVVLVVFFFYFEAYFYFNIGNEI